MAREILLVLVKVIKQLTVFKRFFVHLTVIKYTFRYCTRFWLALSDLGHV